MGKKTKQPESLSPELVGYARVSTEEQTLAMQVEALRKYGVKEDHLWTEKVSAGEGKKRDGLEMAIKDLRPGDTLVVWRLDRIARSMRDLLARMEQIKEAGATFKSLQEGFDFSSISGQFILHILGAVAEFERQLISDRTKSGIESAKARGVRFGRKPVLTPAKQQQAFRLLTDKGLPVKEVAKRMGCVPGTIYKYFRFTKDAKGVTVEWKESE